MLEKYLSDEGGNIALIFSFTSLLLLMGTGMAIDANKKISAKQKIADMADRTALASALVARDGNGVRKKAAKEFFDKNRDAISNVNVFGVPSIVFDDSAKEVTVTVNAKAEYAFMGMFGHKDDVVSASATVGYAIDYVPPISIAFAFDTSGSMQLLTTDGQVKIEALEQATGDLFGAMLDASEQPALLETALTTAFSTYNTDLIINDTPRQGYQHILDTMSDDPLFSADGGTNSTPSIQFAVDQLTAQKAAETDSKWSGHLVFMTDGDNNDPASDTDTLAICNAAKAQGYTIYTVAFAAPKKGEDLLEDCASSKGNAFKSKNAKKLKESFEIIGEELGEATLRIKK